MLRTMMKSKIHRATVTQADLRHVGFRDGRRGPPTPTCCPAACASSASPSGARLETYTIAGSAAPASSASTAAAARLVQPGDLVILIGYGQMETAEARDFRPTSCCRRGQQDPTTGCSPPRAVEVPASVRGPGRRAVSDTAGPDFVLSQAARSDRQQRILTRLR